jgi:hypothetical protein
MQRSCSTAVCVPRDAMGGSDRSTKCVFVRVNSTAASFPGVVNCIAASFPGVVNCIAASFPGVVNCIAASFPGVVNCIAASFPGVVNCIAASFPGVVNCIAASFPGVVNCIAASFPGVVKTHDATCSLIASAPSLQARVSQYSLQDTASFRPPFLSFHPQLVPTFSLSCVRACLRACAGRQEREQDHRRRFDSVHLPRTFRGLTEYSKGRRKQARHDVKVGRPSSDGHH